MRLFYISIIFLFSSCYNKVSNHNQITNETILNIKMDLSAYGVESDGFPNINVYIDFENNSNSCKKWFYNPKYPASDYILSQKEMNKILLILQKVNLQKLKREYRVSRTDQPTSTLIIQTDRKKYTVRDYGLQGEQFLKELYKVVYKL